MGLSFDGYGGTCEYSLENVVAAVRSNGVPSPSCSQSQGVFVPADPTTSNRLDITPAIDLGIAARSALPWTSPAASSNATQYQILNAGSVAPVSATSAFAEPASVTPKQRSWPGQCCIWSKFGTAEILGAPTAPPSSSCTAPYAWAACSQESSCIIVH